jgi:hypothetical protein
MIVQPADPASLQGPLAGGIAGRGGNVHCGGTPTAAELQKLYERDDTDDVSGLPASE